jgi:glyoxylase-like metal-dependent hydrolase (beta-lactamase superfamily II)
MGDARSTASRREPAAEEVAPRIFRIKIPLPGSPLKYLNAYVIRGQGQDLIVDTGLNRDECLSAMRGGLEELGVDLRRADFFITHLHADHFGLIARLAHEGSRVFFNRPDSELIEAWGGWEFMVQYAGLNGFPQDQLRQALEQHPGYRYASSWVPKLNILRDGEGVRVGERLFQCVETPGHTRGHTCLYEPETRTLLSGDHILIDITPNIQCWSDGEDPLKRYLESLEKVRPLEVDRVLPGHRRLFKDHVKRIDELQRHHAARAAEVLAILETGPRNAFEVASRMTWDIAIDSWERFPVAQKWFATGEAISHLRYLEGQGKVCALSQDGKRAYGLGRAGA